MRKIFMISIVLLLSAAFVSTACAADRDAKIRDKAETKFRKAKAVYIAAKDELVDAKIDSLPTIGKSEKQESLDRVRKARKELIAARKKYKKVLSELHKAEITIHAKRDRSPWN